MTAHFKRFFLEVIDALDDASPEARHLYMELVLLSPGFNFEDVEGASYKRLEKRLGMSSKTIVKAIKELVSRRVIAKTVRGPGMPVTYQFVFEYEGATIQIIEGRVALSQESTSSTPLSKESGALSQNHDALSQENNPPYIEREKRIYASLREQVKKQLDNLGYLDDLDELVPDDERAEFINYKISEKKDQLDKMGDKAGAYLRPMITSIVDFNRWKNEKAIHARTSGLERGAQMRHGKTGQVGEWTGLCIALDNGKRIYLDDLEALNAWHEDVA